jgi:hypothetical protein
MKKLFSVLFLLPGLLAFAQEEMRSDEEVRTLFKKGTPVGFFAEWNNRPAENYPWYSITASISDLADTD